MADDTYTVERSLTIDASPVSIYEQVASFHNWTRWSPWEGVDPDLKRTYSGADSGSGAVYLWSGNRKAGQGRMEITDTTVPSRVQIDLAFEKPFRSRSETVFTIQPQGPSGSRVTWSMTGKKTFMTRVMGIFTSMEKLLGPDFEKGLADLKATTERSSAS
jgi:hypothetical protein